jgi:hypothetical protein
MSTGRAVAWHEHVLYEQCVLFLRFVVATPWGEATCFTSPSALRILRHIDGRRTGRQVLERMGRIAGVDLDETMLVQRLAELCRASILDFANGASEQ